MIRFTSRQGALALLLLSGARAEMVISTDPTANMSCSGGVCTPTAKGAVLNVSDLQTMLASSDVQVTTGAGAKTIAVNSSFAWSSTHTLTLHADFDVRVKAAIAVQGAGGLAIIARWPGDLVFFPAGKIDFWDTSSKLSINDAPYTLAADLTTLRQLISDTSGQGWYALTKDYDAGADGVYNDTIFFHLSNTFEGLNHTVSNLKIAQRFDANVGFFGHNERDATTRDVKFADAAVSGGGYCGIAVGENEGAIVNVSSSGQVNGGQFVGGVAGGGEGSIDRSSSSAEVAGVHRSTIGGLVGWASTISNSHATGTVTIAGENRAGGLAGLAGTVRQSYATGNLVSRRPFRYQIVGGLAGDAGAILDSYATGSVPATGDHSKAGGLVGIVGGAVTTSYSTGFVTGASEKSARGRRSFWGGFAGLNEATDTQDYWDVDTSGWSKACGDHCAGVTGLSDTALKAALPAGFDPAIWAQSPAINNGYPYLSKNLPQ